MDLELALELLEDPAYRHVLSNHFPLTGLAIAWIVLVWAAIEARWPSIVFALTLVALCAGSAIPVMEAGDAAYPFVFDELDGTGRAWLDHHTELADRFRLAYPVLAVMAVGAIVLGRGRAFLHRKIAVAVALATLVVLGLGVVIADAGGRIRHDEFRLVDPPSL